MMRLTRKNLRRLILNEVRLMTEASYLDNVTDDAGRGVFSMIKYLEKYGFTIVDVQEADDGRSTDIITDNKGSDEIMYSYEFGEDNYAFTVDHGTGKLAV